MLIGIIEVTPDAVGLAPLPSPVLQNVAQA